MSDLDTKLSAALRDVAAHGRDNARPAPSGDVRRLADHRSHRRHVVVAVASVLAVVTATGLVLGQGPFGRDGGQRVPAAPTTESPLPKLDAKLLLTLPEVLTSVSAFNDESWHEKETGANDAQVISSCQTSDLAQQAGVASWSRAFGQPASALTPETVNELVQDLADEASAHAAFQRAVSWFTGCDMTPEGAAERRAVAGMEQLLGQLSPIAAVDELRTVVRSDGADDALGPAFLVAGVVRVDNRVGVIVWDSKPPYAGGGEVNWSGFTELVRIAASKLAGVESPWVPADAVLQPQDPAVVALSPKAVQDRYLKHDAWEVVSCGRPSSAVQIPPGLVTSQVNDQIYGPVPFISQGLFVFDSEGAAQQWIDELAKDNVLLSCENDPQAAQNAKPVALSVGDQNWATSVDHSVGEHVDATYQAAVRLGRVVTTLHINGENGDPPIQVSEAQARAVFVAAAQRLETVYR